LCIIKRIKMKVTKQPFFIEVIRPQLKEVEKKLLADLGTYNKVLTEAATYLFKAGGKHLRPVLTLLIARMCGNQITSDHITLAISIELLHTATLIHDDIIDMSPMRRGLPSVNFKWNDKISVIAGDFLLARSSYYISKIGNTRLNKLFAKAVMDMCDGEILQLLQRYEIETAFEDYLKKTERKTALLMAVGALASSIISRSPYEKAAYDIGLNIGIAFQVIDDILDFSSDNKKLGKPVGNDLLQGNLTAPVLYALDSADGKRLKELIETKFSDKESIGEALEIINKPQNMDKAKNLAQHYANLAYGTLNSIPVTETHAALDDLFKFILVRSY